MKMSVDMVTVVKVIENLISIIYRDSDNIFEIVGNWIGDSNCKKRCAREIMTHFVTVV